MNRDGLSLLAGDYESKDSLPLTAVKCEFVRDFGEVPGTVSKTAAAITWI